MPPQYPETYTRKNGRNDADVFCTAPRHARATCGSEHEQRQPPPDLLLTTGRIWQETEHCSLLGPRGHSPPGPLMSLQGSFSMKALSTLARPPLPTAGESAPPPGRDESVHAPGRPENPRLDRPRLWGLSRALVVFWRRFLGVRARDRAPRGPPVRPRRRLICMTNPSMTNLSRGLPIR